MKNKTFLIATAVIFGITSLITYFAVYAILYLFYFMFKII